MSEEPRQMTFVEALVSCALHGELTEDMVRDWFEGADLELALKVVRGRHLHRKRTARPRADPLTTPEALARFAEAITYAAVKLEVSHKPDSAGVLARLAAEAWLEGTAWTGEE